MAKWIIVAVLASTTARRRFSRASRPCSPSPAKGHASFLAASKLKPSRDVLVLTSQRLLIFQTNQVLRNGQIVAIDLSSDDSMFVLPGRGSICVRA